MFSRLPLRTRETRAWETPRSRAILCCETLALAFFIFGEISRVPRRLKEKNGAAEIRMFDCAASERGADGAARHPYLKRRQGAGTPRLISKPAFRLLLTAGLIIISNIWLGPALWAR